MRYIEILILLLVVLHAIEHLPHDLSNGRQRVREWARRIFGEGPYPHGSRVAVAALMLMVASISISPVVYYALECGLQFTKPHSEAT